MKFIKTLFTTAILAAVLTSCGGNDKNAATPTPMTTASPQATGDSLGDKMGDAADDIVDGAANQVNDMADTTKKVADDMTR